MKHVVMLSHEKDHLLPNGATLKFKHMSRNLLLNNLSASNRNPINQLLFGNIKQKSFYQNFMLISEK